MEADPVAHGKRVRSDGNCLFRAFSHAITGTQRQHFRIRPIITQYMRSLRRHGLNHSFESSVVGMSVEEHLARSGMEYNGVWGTDTEITALAHLLNINIALFDVPLGQYVVHGPYLVDPTQQIDNTSPAIYLSFTGTVPARVNYVYVPVSSC